MKKENTLNQFESIGAYSKILESSSLKIHNVDEFKKYKIEEIQENTQIDIERIKQWDDMFNLYQIPYLTPRETELLYLLNINSVEELSHRQAIRIFYKLKELDKETYFIILKYPSFLKIQEWIDYAKLLKKNIKFGLNVPLIKLRGAGIINFEIAHKLKNFKIITVEDFIRKSPKISHFRKKINIKKENFEKLNKFIKLLIIEGIDVNLAIKFIEAGLSSPNEIKNLKINEIKDRLKLEIDEDSLKKIKNNIKEDN